MRSAFRAFGVAVVRFRYVIIAAWILFAIICFTVFPSISSVEKDQNSGFLPKNSPSIKAQQLSSGFVNINLGQITLVAVRDSGPLTPKDQQAITAFEARIKAMPHVVKLQDLGTSPDGKARQAQIEAKVPINGTGAADTLVKTIRSEMVKAAPAGMAFHLTGDLPLQIDLNAAQGSSNRQTNILSFVVIIILLLFAFRAILAPILTLITSGLALVLGEYVIAESTKLGTQVSSITSAILIVLVLGAGTDYCVFLLFRMREEVRAGLEPRDAVARSIATVGEPIVFSALTVIAALLSLMFADFGFYQALGTPLAIGIAVMLVAGLTFFPALLSIFGRSVFWPSKRTKTDESQVGWWGAVAGRVVRYPLGTLVAGIAVFVLLALGNVGVSNIGFGGSSNAPSGSDSAAGQAALQAHWTGSATYPEFALFKLKAPVWRDPAAAVRAQTLLAHDPAFKTVSGPFAMSGQPGLTGAQLTALYRKLGPPQQLPAQGIVSGVSPQAYNAYRFTAQFISRDGHVVQFLTTPRNNDIGKASAINAVPALRDVLTSVGQQIGAVDTGLFGYLAFSYDINTVSSNDLHRIIPIVAVLIALLLALVLRSLIAPLYLVASVILSYLAALGLAAIIFVHIGGQSGLNFVLPFIMFIFLMALGSDYNILVMSRIREEAEQVSMRHAVARAVAATGTTITTAGLILGGTFAVLGFTAPAGSNGDQIRQIGYGIAAGILMDTFLVRTLLVPSIASLLGRWNWWPSHLWSHPVTDESEHARYATEEVS